MLGGSLGGRLVREKIIYSSGFRSRVRLGPCVSLPFGNFLPQSLAPILRLDPGPWPFPSILGLVYRPLLGMLARRFFPLPATSCRLRPLLPPTCVSAASSRLATRCIFYWRSPRLRLFFSTNKDGFWLARLHQHLPPITPGLTCVLRWTITLFYRRTVRMDRAFRYVTVFCSLSHSLIKPPCQSLFRLCASAGLCVNVGRGELGYVWHERVSK